MTPESLRIAFVRDVLTGRFTESKNETALKGIDEEYFDIYQIPASWDIVTLKDCCYLHARIGWQALRKDEHQSQGDYLLITGTDFRNGFVDYSTCVYVSKERYDMDEKIKLQNDDILVTKDGSIGKVAVVKNLPKPATLNAGVFVVRPDDRFEKRYIEYLFQCSYFSRFVNLVKSGSTIKHLNQNKLQQFIIPVPSKREQIEIVKILDNWLPKIDAFEQLDNKLNTLNATFPEMMKKSILQEAVQGKLVPQDPNDEPASLLLKKIAEEKKRLIKEGKIKKQKPLPEITEDEIPFDIPESWEWVRLNDCMDVRDGTHDSPKYHSEGYPLVTSKNLRDGRIDFSTCKLISKEDFESINQRSRVDSGDILFAMIGTVGNPVLFHGKADFSIKNMALFKHIGNYLNMEYVYWFLSFAQSDMKKQATGGVQNFVSLNYLRNYLIPIPPANEQGNIVKAIERIIPELNNLMV